MKRFLGNSALALFLILLFCGELLYQQAPKLVFYGAYFGNTQVQTVADTLPGMQAVSLKAADGTTLHGWLLNRGQKAPLVVVYGGNNMNVGAFAGLSELAAHSSFLLLNHRGYGKSEGVPSEQLVVEDARQALRYFRQYLGEPERVILLGFSLGTGVATQVADSEKVDQLILACPFDSVLATACQHIPVLPEYLPLDPFRSDLAAPQVRCPVTILMATQDTIVPNERTLNLQSCFTNTQAQLHRVECGHNDIMLQPAARAIIQPLLQGWR